MLAIVFFCVLCGIEVKIYTSFTTVFNGVRKIAPEENCPLVRVRVWFRISVRIRAGGNFSWGQFPRTVKINIWWSNQYTEAFVQMFFKIGVLHNFLNFTEKHLCRSLFLVCCRPEACARTVSVSKYIIISNHCIKVNVWSIAWFAFIPR